MKLIITVAILFMATLSAEAQVEVETIPAAPIAGHAFLIQFRSPAILELRSVARAGDHFVFELNQCHITCIQDWHQVAMPALAEGTYTYEIIIGNTSWGTGSFAVAPAPYGPITVQVVPLSPRPGQNVFLRFFNPNILDDYTFEREGNHFRFRFGGCHVTCISIPNVELGPLAEGTYTYEVFIEDIRAGHGLLAVAAAPSQIPALSPWMLGTLSVVLIAAGWFVIGRRA